ncbi:MAG: hypothetical protein JSS66_06390 [Armatimonadetes bacterium]|nr:hypothetical protein [Armatimonadota bacterium]
MFDSERLEIWASYLLKNRSGLYLESDRLTRVSLPEGVTLLQLTENVVECGEFVVSAHRPKLLHKVQQVSNRLQRQVHLCQQLLSIHGTSHEEYATRLKTYWPKPFNVRFVNDVTGSHPFDWYAGLYSNEHKLAEKCLHLLRHNTGSLPEELGEVEILLDVGESHIEGCINFDRESLHTRYAALSHLWADTQVDLYDAWNAVMPFCPVTFTPQAAMLHWHKEPRHTTARTVLGADYSPEELWLAIQVQLPKALANASQRKTSSARPVMYAASRAAVGGSKPPRHVLTFDYSGTVNRDKAKCYTLAAPMMVEFLLRPDGTLDVAVGFAPGTVSEMDLSEFQHLGTKKTSLLDSVMGAKGN